MEPEESTTPSQVSRPGLEVFFPESSLGRVGGLPVDTNHDGDQGRLRKLV